MLFRMIAAAEKILQEGKKKKVISEKGVRLDRRIQPSLHWLQLASIGVCRKLLSVKEPLQDHCLFHGSQQEFVL